VFLHFILRVEVIEIQIEIEFIICLQIIKRFEKKRIFLTSTQNGLKPSSPWNEPSPSSVYFSVHGPAALTPAHLSSRPAPVKNPVGLPPLRARHSGPTHPVRPSTRVEPLLSGGSTATPLLAARHRLLIAELTPCPCLTPLCSMPRSCLPQTLPPMPNFHPSHGNHRIQAEGLSPTKLIVKSSTNPQRSLQESLIRLEEIFRTLFHSCWTPWATNRST
jgi:hypothetical protein